MCVIGIVDSRWGLDLFSRGEGRSRGDFKSVGQRSWRLRGTSGGFQFPFSLSGRLHSLIYISIPCFPLGDISPARQLLAQHLQVALMVSFCQGEPFPYVLHCFHSASAITITIPRTLRKEMKNAESCALPLHLRLGNHRTGDTLPERMPFLGAL